MGDAECENFFRINLDKYWSWFHQKAAHVGSSFAYSIFSFKKLTFDELKMIIKECQLTVLLVLTHIQVETQKHVIEVLEVMKPLI